MRARGRWGGHMSGMRKADPMITYISIGQRFGRLTVTGLGRNRHHKTNCICLCDCGVTTLVDAVELRRGNTRSCGCYRRERMAAKNVTHAKSSTPEWKCWRAMRKRCLNITDRQYSTYGGRGISVCERWLSFENFLADMGERPSLNHSLDRFPDMNGNY